jgi:hypothetical protein
MAFPTAVNDQITDSVTQSGVQTLGTAPALALANLYQSTAQALANAAHNATAAQQQMWITSQAATTAGTALIYNAARGPALDALLSTAGAPEQPLQS